MEGQRKWLCLMSEPSKRSLQSSSWSPHGFLVGFMLEPSLGRRPSMSTLRVDYRNGKVSTLSDGVLNFVVIAVAESMGRDKDPSKPGSHVDCEFQKHDSVSSTILTVDLYNHESCMLTATNRQRFLLHWPHVYIQTLLSAQLLLTISTRLGSRRISIRLRYSWRITSFRPATLCQLLHVLTDRLSNGKRINRKVGLRLAPK